MTLKVKFRTQFPAVVTGNSPILITKTGLSYTFGLDANALEATLGGVYALTSGTLAQFQQTTSAQLLGVISDETGTGSLVFASSPTLVTPEIGSATAASINLRALTASQVVVSDGSKNLASVAITGTGTAVFATSPTLVTPILGVASATTINKVTFTAPATGSTLTIPDGVVLTGPAASGTVMTLGNAETVSGVKSFNDATVILKGSSSGTTTLKSGAAAGSSVITLPVATDTLVGKATTDTLTNKTFNSSGTGNVLQVSGVTVSSGQYPGETSTGSATAGNVGEYIESVIASGSAVPLSNGVSANITSITLSAGDWDVDASVYYVTSTTTSVTALLASLSTTTATLDQTAGRWFKNVFAAFVPGAAGTAYAQNIPPYRFSISGSTTVFLVVNAGFTASTLTGWGLIRARRVR